MTQDQYIFTDADGGTLYAVATDIGHETPGVVISAESGTDGDSVSVLVPLDRVEPFLLAVRVAAAQAAVGDTP